VPTCPALVAACDTLSKPLSSLAHLPV
jgi:hypothetical protein